MLSSRFASVSVVLLCRNQLSNLASILAALQRQTTRPQEVIISDDDSFAPIERFAADNDCRYVRTQRPQSARNIGMRALAREIGTLRAQGDVILYLDGDIIPASGVIERALQWQKRKRDAAVKVLRRYHVTIDSRVLPITGWRKELPEANMLFKSFYSDCFAIRRGTVLEVGGWDTNFVGWGEEDVEFAFRCQKASVPLLFPEDPDLFTTHIDHRVNSLDKFSSLVRNLAYFRRKYIGHPTIRNYALAALRGYSESFTTGGIGTTPVIDAVPAALSPTVIHESECRSQLTIPEFSLYDSEGLS